ncbi:VIT1/CCC1 transporter family protein [Pseudomonas sp. GCEP-101]|uniref:VIT1/CCC1 transporter family protein n=1 Tax=Pseudomonas sp. GCEP-101 TaxID=2974552 RepID=UPI00223AFB76|nr:VIT1/CCC1 transporter family protein [Pseudomonas sp. GCEP-101]
MENVEKGTWQRVLEPVDRITEVIFGLLMAMTFIGSLSVATSGREEARTMLIAALGCNLAWGLADAVIFLMRTWTERTRSRTLLQRLQGGADPRNGHYLIAAALPPRIATAAGAEGLEMLRVRLLGTVGTPVQARIGWADLKGALATFLLVVLATFPLVIPFLLIPQTGPAIRASNAVALVMLFLSGWMLARYSGGSPWAGGLALAVVGTALLFAIIALGG